MKRFAAMHDCPLLMVRAFDRRRCRSVEVGARHDDERIAAAELEDRLLDAAARRGWRRCAPARSLPVSVDGGDARIVEQPAHRRGRDQQRLKDAVVEAGARKMSFDAPARTAARSTRA